LTQRDMHAHTAPACTAGLRIFDLQPGDSRWGRFVSDNPDALPYHHPAWFQVLQDTFGYRSAVIGCSDDGAGRLCGVLPLMEKRSLMAGSYLSSLPHTPLAGPVAADRRSLDALLSAATSRTDQTPARWLQLRSMDSSLSGLGDGLSQLSWEAAYVMELPDDPERLRFGKSRNQASVLRAVRKAGRSGVVVRDASSVQDVRRWYNLYLETVRAHAVPPRPFRFFQLMWEILAPQGRLRLLLAERSSGGRTELLAGSLYLLHGFTIIYAFNGRDHTQLQFRPNDAIHWKAITEACTSGFRRYDFGEVASSNDGLAHFKAKWGASPVPLYRYYYPRQHEVKRDVLGPGPLRSTAEWAWRRLPLPVTEGLGGWIYRHL
jgi:CelD/BcsL family acetyltransferase involved in cellulose biosynthesis